MDVAAFIVKYNSSTAGRDKLCRTGQYLSKYLWNYLNDHDGRKDLIRRIKTLESVISTSRKTFRLGKTIDMLQSAMRATRLEDPVARVCTVLAKLFHSVYFLFDIGNWACRAAIVRGNAKQWAVRGAPYWFLAILFSLLRNIYEVCKAIKLANAKRNSVSTIEEFDSQPGLSVGKCLADRPALTVDLLKNCCDLLIPLNVWGVITVRGQTIGKLGVVSSLCGMAAIVYPSLKFA